MEAIFMRFSLCAEMLRAANVRARGLLPDRRNNAFAAPYAGVGEGSIRHRHVAGAAAMRLWQRFLRTAATIEVGSREQDCAPALCIEMEKWPYHTPAWKAWLADTRAGNTSSPA
jgi:hypothetical protein